MAPFFSYWQGEAPKEHFVCCFIDQEEGESYNCWDYVSLLWIMAENLPDQTPVLQGEIVPGQAQQFYTPEEVKKQVWLTPEKIRGGRQSVRDALEVIAKLPPDIPIQEPHRPRSRFLQRLRGLLPNIDKDR